MPLLLVTLSLFMLLLNLALTWVLYLLVLVAGTEFNGIFLSWKRKSSRGATRHSNVPSAHEYKAYRIAGMAGRHGAGVKCLALVAIQQPEAFRKTRKS